MHSILTLLIGPSLRRPDGISVAFKIVNDGFVERGLRYKIIDIGTSDNARAVGTFSFKRVVEIFYALMHYAWFILNSQNIYLLVGQSRVSFFRDLIFIWSAHMLGCRIVLHVHSGGYGEFYKSRPPWLRRLIAKTLNCADAIIVLGNSLRNQFSFLRNDEKLHVVPNCSPSDPIRRNFQGKGISRNKPISLLYLSNLIETKGYLDCIDACNILYHERRIPFHFDLCGGFVLHSYGSNWNSEEEAITHLENKIVTLGLSDVISYNGIVSGRSKHRYLLDADILILPTYYAWEGQPISIVEALAYGIPVISTNYRAIPEQIINNINGLFVEPRTPIGIADCVEYLWNNPKDFSTMSINARKYYLENFTRDKHLSLLIPIILGEHVP